MSAAVITASGRTHTHGGLAEREHRIAQVVSIADARQRLRGDTLDASIARHPASRARAARPGVAITHSSQPSSLTYAAPVAIRTFLRALAWVMAVIIAFSLAWSLGSSLRSDPMAAGTWTHSVTAGESVWGIAASLGSTRAVEDVVADIMELNGLQTGAIHPGQDLIVPAK